MSVYSRGLSKKTFFDRVVIDTVSPFHQCTTFIVDWVKGIWNGYIWFVDVKEENLRLKKKLDELEKIHINLQEIELENQRLKDLLEFRNTLPTDIISAQVIGKGSTNWFQTVLLNKGSMDGVCVNQPVVTHQGLIGKVIRITPSSAQVELITDKNSRVAAMILKNRTEAILYGQSGPICSLEYLDRDTNVAIGDCVISSGMGGIFPKGIILGELSRVEKSPHGLFQYAEVTPFVKFSKLEEVMILKIKNEGYNGIQEKVDY